MSNAKASQAVLMCEMERGTVDWCDTTRIDRIRRAHAQKHNPPVKIGSKVWMLKRSHGIVSHFSWGFVNLGNITMLMGRFTNIYVPTV